MGNILTNDVASNAKNTAPEAKQGSAVVHVRSNGSIISNDNSSQYSDISRLESQFTNKFDEVDYYEIPGALHGGGITPTPSPTVSFTPTPYPTPTPTPTSVP